MFSVYIIKNRTNNYYVGFTSNIDKRLKHHNSNKSRSTKNKGPWKLVHIEVFNDKKSAWLREKQIKNYKGGEAFKKLVITEGC